MDRHTFDPGPIAKVECHRENERWTLVFVRELRHPPEKVWAALTEADQLNQWSPFAADRDLDRTGEATLTMIDGEVSQAVPATVLLAEPPIVLEYTWGDDLLRWELESSTTGTQLTLRHTLDNRDHLPKVAAGWHICLVVAEQLLTGDPIGVIRGRDAMEFGWQDLRDAYAGSLGAAGTT